MKLDAAVEEAFAERSLLERESYRAAVREAVDLLDRGEARIAEPGADGEWVVHAWLQKAVVLYFAVGGMEVTELGPFEFHDKVPLKKGLAEARVRVVPPGTVRYGAYCEPGVVVMPGYVNIGSRVGAGTMVDTWATVGSCAQIGANVVLTMSTPIVDVRGDEATTTRGFVPPDSVVIPGSLPKRFPAGEFGVPCALIIGRRKPSTDLKTSLNETLREFAVSV